MEIKLSKPIRPGYRRAVTLVPDAPVDLLPGEVYAKVSVVDGNSTIAVRPETTAEEIKLWVNGDGAIGAKLARLRVDAHLGEGDVELNVDIAWEVAHPDATSISLKEEGEDEPIPAPTEPTE